MNSKYNNLKLSIISSSADFSFAKTLKNILRPLISNVWYYEDILAGDTIKSSVEKEIEESDIILILLSSDFFYELYSLEGYNKDMPKILSSFQNKGKAIFPVLLRSCIYDLLELGVLLNDCQFAFDEIPIYSYTLETRDEAINKIVKKVDLLLSNINDAFVRIAIPNWIGYAGGVYANKGLDANKDSELTKVSDKLVEFIVEDDLQKIKQKLYKNTVNIAWSTLDQFSYIKENELNEHLECVFVVSKSITADVIIQKEKVKENTADVSSEEKSIANFYEILKDISKNDSENGHKRPVNIAVTNYSPSLTFLLQVLGSIDGFDTEKKQKKFSLRFINSTNKDDGIANTIDKGSENIPINVFLFGDIQETSNYFVNESDCDFFVTWKPYDQPINDAREVLSTQNLDSAHISIYDILIAKSSYIEKNKKNLQKIFKAWGNAVNQIYVNRSGEKDEVLKLFDTSIVDKLAKDAPDYLKKRFIDNLDNKNGINGVLLCDLNANMKFFALDFHLKNKEKQSIGEEEFEKIYNLYYYFFQEYGFYHPNIKINPYGAKIIDSSIINNINSKRPS